LGCSLLLTAMAKVQLDLGLDPLGELASACIILRGCVVPVAHTFLNLDVSLDVGDTNLRPWFVFGPGDTKYIHAYNDWTWDDSRGRDFLLSKNNTRLAESLLPHSQVPRFIIPDICTAWVDV
jgi:hypothetical protein